MSCRHVLAATRRTSLPLDNELRCIEMGDDFYMLGVLGTTSLADCKKIATHLDLLVEACDDDNGGHKITCNEFGPTRWVPRAAGALRSPCMSCESTVKRRAAARGRPALLCDACMHREPLGREGGAARPPVQSNRMSWSAGTLAGKARAAPAPNVRFCRAIEQESSSPMHQHVWVVFLWRHRLYLNRVLGTSPFGACRSPHTLVEWPKPRSSPPAPPPWPTALLCRACGPVRTLRPRAHMRAALYIPRLRARACRFFSAVDADKGEAITKLLETAVKEITRGSESVNLVASPFARASTQQKEKEKKSLGPHRRPLFMCASLCSALRTKANTTMRMSRAHLLLMGWQAEQRRRAFVWLLS